MAPQNLHPIMGALTLAELLAIPKDVEQQARMEIAMKMMESAAAHPQAAFTNFAAVDAGGSTAPADPGVLFNEGLSHPEVKKKAHEDIKKLAQTMNSIHESFWVTHRQLETADIRYGISRMTRQEVPLSTKWKEIWDRMWDAYMGSATLAPSAVTMLKKVVDVLGSTESTKQGDMKVRLKNFMDELKVKEGEALKVKSGFQDVVDRLRIFWADVKIIMEHPWCQLITNYVFKSLDKRIEEISQQVEALQRKTAALQSVLVNEVSTGGIGAALSIFQLCPSAFYEVMTRTYGVDGAGKALADAKVQKDAAQAEYEKTRVELDQAIAKHTTINGYWSVLRQPKSHLEDIAVKLDTIVNIWQTINLDMHALHEDLSGNVSDDAVITKFFVSKLRVSKAIYEELAWMLELYAERV